jgi:hypothetical protein
MIRTSCFYIITWIILFAAIGFSLPVPLVIKTPGDTIENAIPNISYTNFPVTSGVPFAKGEVPDVNALVLEDGQANQVPVQFRVTSKWKGDNSVKWVLVDFQATAAHGQETVYWITRAPKAQLPASKLTVTDLGSTIEVNTGALKFTIAKTNTQFLENVYIDANNNGQADRQVISTSGNTGIYMVGKDNVRRSLEPGATAQIEYQGNMRASILIKGIVKNQSGEQLEATVRIWAYEGKPYIRTFYTITNRTGGFRPFKEVSVDLDMVMDANRTVTANRWMDTDTPYQESYGGAAKYELHINNPFDYPCCPVVDIYDEFVSGVNKNGSAVAGQTGKRNLGYFDVSDGNYGVTVSIRRFWQNYPKAIEADGSRLSIKLWPKDVYTGSSLDWARGLGGHPFAKGRQKTHVVWLNFHAGPATEQNSWQLFKQMQKIPFAWAGNGQYAKSNACLIPLSMTRDWDQTILPQRFKDGLKHFDRWCNVRFDSTQADQLDGFKNRWWQVSFETMGRRGGARGSRRAYWGWEHYGCFPWSEYYSSQHYDFPYGTYLQYMRSGNYAAFDFIYDHAMHRYDVDQYHNLDPGEHDGWSMCAGGQQYEKGWHGVNVITGKFGTGNRPMVSHLWTAGILLHWALTGDELAMDAVRENVDVFILRENWNFLLRKVHELRRPGWALEALAELYSFTGEQNLFDKAKTLIDTNISFEEIQGRRGWIADSEGKAQVWMHHFFGSAVFQWVWHYGQWPTQRWKDFMTRFVNKMITTAVWPASGSGRNYRPTYTFNWLTDIGARERLMIKNIELVDLFGWNYLLLDSTSSYADSIMDKARTMFIDGNFYFQSGGPDSSLNGTNVIDSATGFSIFKNGHPRPVDESKPYPEAVVNPAWYMNPKWTGVSMRTPQYGTTESKAHGTHGRWQNIFIAAELKRHNIPWGHIQYHHPSLAVDNSKIAPLNSLKVWPNPFGPQVTIQLPHMRNIDQNNVSLKILNIKGQVVNDLTPVLRTQFSKTLHWSAKNRQKQPLAAGIYLLKLRYNDRVLSQKILSIK